MGAFPGNCGVRRQGGNLPCGTRPCLITLARPLGSPFSGAGRARDFPDQQTRGELLERENASSRSESTAYVRWYCLAAAEPHDRCIASRPVRLLADFDIGHGDLGGDMTFLSPIRRLCNR